jgi:hypothetical protein
MVWRAELHPARKRFVLERVVKKVEKHGRKLFAFDGRETFGEDH